MRRAETVTEMRERLAESRRDGRAIGLVPTMGALHGGHASLIERAAVECDEVVVSVFVNPTQFAPDEDLERYPRREQADAEIAERSGASVLFMPSAAEVYPPGFATTVSVHGLTESLCGSRRGVAHFAGVATVVTKLLNMVGPDVAYFGQKDAQQAIVIKRLVADLDIPVRIVICPTVREPDGLAMSSRNAYLEPEDRPRAVALRRALIAAEEAVSRGERDTHTIAALARRELELEAIEPEYVELVSPVTLTPVETVKGPVLVALAATVGGTRLIDNTVLEPSK